LVGACKRGNNDKVTYLKEHGEKLNKKKKKG